MAAPTADRLQTFLVSIASLAGDEARKAKLLYVRNELAEYEEKLENAASFGVLQLFFALIPFFWPILYAQRRSTVAEIRKQHQQIANAIEVWKADLGDEVTPLTTELDRLRARSPRLLPWGKRS